MKKKLGSGPFGFRRLLDLEQNNLDRSNGCSCGFFCGKTLADTHSENHKIADVANDHMYNCLHYWKDWCCIEFVLQFTFTGDLAQFTGH